MNGITQSGVGLPSHIAPAVIVCEKTLYVATDLILYVPALYVYATGLRVDIEAFYPYAPKLAERRTELQHHRIRCVMDNGEKIVTLFEQFTGFEDPWPGHVRSAETGSRHATVVLWVAHLPDRGDLALTHVDYIGSHQSTASLSVTFSAAEVADAAKRSVVWPDLAPAGPQGTGPLG